ncbi:MAG: hypothetical protein JWP03_3394 [Phycisphaerales bacterium]|nr:hypothetical protein [Phycisphaerales bacterium]
MRFYDFKEPGSNFLWLRAFFLSMFDWGSQIGNSI